MKLKNLSRIVAIPALLGLVCAGVFGHYIGVSAGLIALGVGFGAALLLAIVAVIVLLLAALSALYEGVAVLGVIQARLLAMFERGDDETGGGGSGGGEVIYDDGRPTPPAVRLFPTLN